MREIKVTNNESGQRIDRFLKKYLNKANNSFIYKMLRKKNIKLNNKKALPETMLKIDDMIQIYFTDETIEKFRENKSYKGEIINFQVVYEDKNILVVNKPQGINTQPDAIGKSSLIGEILTYLNYNNNENLTFTPAVCNRLDKNTSGLVIAAKNYETLKQVNRAIRERKIKKYYLTVVHGELNESIIIERYLIKNKNTNKVQILSSNIKGSKKIITKIEPLKKNNKYTMLEVQLITGRTHQIRAQLAEMGYPLIGEKKYTNKNKINNNSGMKYQFLHAYKLRLDGFEKDLEYLNGKTIRCDIPNKHKQFLKEMFKY